MEPMQLAVGIWKDRPFATRSAAFFLVGAGDPIPTAVTEVPDDP